MTNNNQMSSENQEQPVEQTIFKKDSSPVAVEKKPTMSGLDENLAGLLCYIFSIVTGVIFLVIEKENQFIRFHAMQAIFTFIVFFGVGIVLGFIPVIGWIISILISPVGFFLSIFLMYQAYQGKMFKLPVIGDMAEKHSMPK